MFNRFFIIFWHVENDDFFLSKLASQTGAKPSIIFEKSRYAIRPQA
jgi:hypothetical protein